MSNSSLRYCQINADSRIADGFLYWHEKTPKSIALNINNIDYTYEDLFVKSVSIYTKIKYIDAELLGIQCIHSVDSYAAILAVSYIGSAYLPLNSKFPTSKISEIVNDSQLKVVLSFNNEFDFLSTDSVQVIQIHLNQVEEKLSLKNNSELAYVLYTSGSTGKPKGVPISKKNVNAFFDFFLREYDFNTDDRFLQPYELSFDVSVFSVFCAWNVGASVYVVIDSITKHIEIFKAIKQYNITVASMVPSTLSLTEKYFPEFNFPYLRYSFFSGDSLKQSVVKKWKNCLPNGVIHNFYGPTETTIVCTRYVWDVVNAEQESINDIVPIGKPFPLMNFIIVSEENTLITDLNAQGELCFEGIQVIDNYLKNAHLEKFLIVNGIRYYRTGDIVSLNNNGNLIFHGRLDSQVKISGYRIELKEIENAIATCSDCNSIVLMIEKNGLKKLVAFIESEHEIDVNERLIKLLPSYMIPKQFLFLKKIPLTLNGKVDIEQLKQMVN